MMTNNDGRKNMIKNEEVLYFEAHVTVEPVFDERLLILKCICDEFKFRVAELLMKKKKNDAAKNSELDSFCSSRSDTYADIHNRTVSLVKTLKTQGFSVYRYKIEIALLDSKINDSENLLM